MAARDDYPLLARIGRYRTQFGVWGEAHRALTELDQLRDCVQPPVDRDGNELRPHYHAPSIKGLPGSDCEVCGQGFLAEIHRPGTIPGDSCPTCGAQMMVAGPPDSPDCPDRWHNGP
jgi:hypothetical protein